MANLTEMDTPSLPVTATDNDLPPTKYRDHGVNSSNFHIWHGFP